MSTKFDFADIRGTRYAKDRDPEHCPACHYAIQPAELAHSLSHLRNADDARLEIAYRCPRSACEVLFIARYRAHSRRGYDRIRVGEFKLVSCAPRTPETPTVPEQVREISPGFVEVYTESLAAEAYGLRQIAGAGLRKAVEHLVKDYCILKHPEDEADIKDRFLGSCIKKYVEDPRVADCASRAVWLGNDETHYLRKWVAHDIADLKILIRLTLNWIESAELTDQDVSRMENEGGPPADNGV